MTAADDYYRRLWDTDPDDGGIRFATKQDEANERAVAEEVEKAWRCNVHRYPRLHQIDFYAERGGYLKANLEVKARTHPTTQYATVLLNVRKWITLVAADLMSGIPSLYVVKFTDGIRWVRVTDIDIPPQIPIGGTKRIVKSSSDREPVLHVPVAAMHTLGGGE